MKAKKIFGICVLILLAVAVMAGCSRTPSEKEIIALVSEYEGLPATGTVTVDDVQKNEDAFDVTVSIKQNYETYETIQAKTYTLAYADNTWNVQRVEAENHPTCYPLIGSDITAEDIVSDLAYYKFEVNGTDEIAFISEPTLMEVERKTSIDNPPYTDTVVYDVKKETEYFSGKASIKVNMIFSEDMHRWNIDNIEQIEPMVFEWKEGKAFEFNDADFTDYMGYLFTSLTFTSDEAKDEVTFGPDAVYNITVQQQPTPISLDTCEAIIDIDATNHVYSVKAKLSCLYGNDGANAWSIKEINILSTDSIERPDLMGTWEGYTYFKNSVSYYDAPVKHSFRIVFDEYIESNGQYSGTAYLFGDESFEENKLLVSYKIRAEYDDLSNCLDFNPGEILKGDIGYAFIYAYTFSDDKTLIGEINSFSFYVGDINESELKKIE
jgi:hypothetical protein